MLSLLILFFLNTGYANELEVAAPPAKNSEVIFEYRSDLWTNIYANKSTPVRLYELSFVSHWLEQGRWKSDFLAGMESFSSGRADLIVGPQRTLVGSDLRDQKIGTHLSYDGDDGSLTKLGLIYESASDQPFQNSRDTWVELDIDYFFPRSEKHQYFFEINDSKNRGYLNQQFIFLPGVLFNVGEDWRYSFTLTSFKLEWQKDAEQKIDLKIEPLKSRLQYRKNLTKKRIYEAALGITSRGYLNVGRNEDHIRVYFEESYLENSIYYQLSAATYLKFNLGLSFNRFLYEAKQIYMPIGRRSTMPSDWFGGLRWEFLF